MQVASIPDSDGQLLSRLAAGERDAAAELYDRYAAAIYGLARRILRDDADAEDVVQEVFSQAWRTADKYQTGRATVVGWLLMMTRTRAIDRIRARRARPDMAPGAMPDVLPSSEPPPSDVLLAAETADQIRSALRELPESQRIALEMAYFDGMTQAEIATRLDEPLGTIKTRMRSALGTLRQRLRT